MHPELPYLAAGAVAIGSGVRREHGWPKNGLAAVIATFLLVIVASASAGSKAESLVRAIGLLVLGITVMAAVPAFTAKRKKT